MKEGSPPDAEVSTQQAAEIKSERRKKLDYLAKEAQALNLGYE